MQKIPALLMIIVLIVGLFLMRESRMAPLDEVDEMFVDWLAANTSHNLPTARCVLVEINDSSLEDKHAWPWSPLDFALFLQAILEFEPKVIAIAPVLEWEDQPAGDGEGLRRVQFEHSLDDFILRAKSIVLGADLGFPPDPDVVPPLQPAPFFRHVRGDAGGLRQFTAIEEEPKEEYRVAPQLALGFLNLPARNEVTRSMPLVLNYRGMVVPSFVLQTVLLSMKLTTDDVTVDLGSSVQLGNKGSIPIDGAGAMRVDFGSPITRFGFDDLLLAVQQAHSGRPPIVPLDLLRGRVVLLARTDKAACTLRLPSGREGSPGELFAAAIATIQNQAFAHRVSALFDLLLIGILTALGYFLVRWSLARVIVISLIVFIFYLLISMMIFGTFLLWFPVLLPAGLFLTLFVLRLLAPRLWTSREEAGQKT